MNHDHRSHDRPRASRWTAPLTSALCLVVLAAVHTWWTFTRALDDLKPFSVENPATTVQIAQAAAQVRSTANLVLGGTMLVVVVAGLAGAVRPVPHAPRCLVLLTSAALIAVWVATRADVTFLHSFGWGSR